VSASDRLATALRSVNDAINPRLAFLATWEYRVLAATPGPPTTIDCSALDAETSAVLPQQLAGLTLWPGPSGLVAVPQTGSIVRIAFVNGDPSKPAVVGLDPNGTPLLVMGFVETVLQLGDASAAPVTPTAWSAGVAAALLELGTSLAAFGVGPPTPLTPLGVIGTALVHELASLPPPATTKLLGT